MKNAKRKKLKAFLLEQEERVTSLLNPPYIQFCVILAENRRNALEIAHRQLSLWRHRKGGYYLEGQNAYDCRVREIKLVEKKGRWTFPPDPFSLAS